MNPPSQVRVVSTKAQPNAPKAPGDIALFQTTGLANAPVVGGVARTSSTTNEGSLGSNGRVVFWTQNWYAAVSGDRGQTFSYLNPYDNFPADGTKDAVNGGFCCDQLAYYERTRGLMFWLLQYQPDNNTNTQRLAIARTQADVLNNSWYYYDFTPATYGFVTPPAGASGFWLDFPDVAVSDNFLYLTTNVFPRVLPNPTNQCAGTCPARTCPGACTSCTSNCGSVGAVIARIPLDQLAAAQALNFIYYSDATTQGYRCTQGAHGTMYWGSHNTNTQIRIYRWDENSNNVAWDIVSHSAFFVGTMVAPSPDGTDFAGSGDTRILGAWVANGVIGFMWNAPQGVFFAYPHVEVVRFNESNRTLLTQGQVYSDSYAFLYPSVHPNDRGHLGGTMAYGGGSLYPSELAWIADDINNGTITPILDSIAVATGNAGPASNRWGDYLTTRLNTPYSNTWVGSGYVLSGGTGNANVVPRFIWFGRERDTPPSTNTIYVDKSNTSGYEDGSATHPYNTVTEGHFAAMPNDTLIIRAANYNETVRFTTPVTVRNEGGIVKIGAP